jgi:hypothetical protein
MHMLVYLQINEDTLSLSLSLSLSRARASNKRRFFIKPGHLIIHRFRSRSSLFFISPVYFVLFKIRP